MNSDSRNDLERELARLRAENTRLLRLLELTPQQARAPTPTQTGLFLEPPGPVHAQSSSQEKVRFFRALFATRRDVYEGGAGRRGACGAGGVPARGRRACVDLLRGRRARRDRAHAR
jgi:hypothetical protein